MIAFFFCAVVGSLQTLLLSVVLKGALSGRMKAAVIALLLKMFMYAIGFSVLYFFFMDSVYYAAAGFAAGIIMSVIYTAIKNKNKPIDNIEKGDDQNEYGGRAV